MATLEMLENGCKSGEYYAPLQSFKALINRKANGPRKNFEEAVALIFQGARAAAAGFCSEVAIDLLGDSLVQLLQSFQKQLDSETVSLFHQVSEVFAASSTSSPQQASWAAAYASVLDALMRWAASASRSDSLTDSERDVLPILLATAHHNSFRSNKNIASLTRAAQVILKTTTNPSLTSTILSSVVSVGRPSEVNVLVTTFVGSLLQLVETRPSGRANIIAAAKRVVFSCNAVPEGVATWLRVAFRVVDAAAGTICEKSGALRFVIVESPCGGSLLPDQKDRETLLRQFEATLSVAAA
jgi:hypothetical protein